MRDPDLFSSEAYRSLLGELGFSLLKRSSDTIAFGFIYRPTIYRSSSPDGLLEYFVLLGRDIKRRVNFVGAFGIRNEDVDRFSHSCMLEFGAENLKYWWSNHPPDFDFYCVLFRAFDRLEFTNMAMLNIYRVENIVNSPLSAHVSQVMRTNIAPTIRSISSLEEFLALLVRDAGPWSWDLSHPVARASQIIAISLRLGLPISHASNLLHPHARRIETELHASGFPISADQFVAQVAMRWTENTRSL